MSVMSKQNIQIYDRKIQAKSERNLEENKSVSIHVSVQVDQNERHLKKDKQNTKIKHRTMTGKRYRNCKCVH